MGGLGLVAFAGIGHAPAEQRIGDAGVEPQSGVVIGDGTIQIAGPQIGVAPAIENHRGVAGVQLQRFVAIRNGPPDLADDGIAVAARHVIIGIPGIGVDRARIVLDRLEIVALGLIGETTVEIGKREAGVPADRRIVVAYGQVILIFSGIGIPPIVVAAGEIRIEPKGGLAIRERQVEFAFVVERRATIVESQLEAEFAR